jgi:hypothetical protein
MEGFCPVLLAKLTYSFWNFCHNEFEFEPRKMFISERERNVKDAIKTESVKSKCVFKTRPSLKAAAALAKEIH